MLASQPLEVADHYQVLQRRFNEYLRAKPPENAFPTFLEALYFEIEPHQVVSEDFADLLMGIRSGRQGDARSALSLARVPIHTPFTVAD